MLVVLFGITDGSVGMVDTVESYVTHRDCAEAAMRYNDRNDPRYGTHVCIRDTDLAAFRASVQMARKY